MKSSLLATTAALAALPRCIKAAPSCSHTDDAEFLEKALNKRDYYAGRADINCRCLPQSESPIEDETFIFCLIDYKEGETCDQRDCNRKGGYGSSHTCSENSGDSVTVCQTKSGTEVWMIKEYPNSCKTCSSGIRHDYNRYKVTDTRHYTKGVSNLTTWTVALDKQGLNEGRDSCIGFYVDGKKCERCDICEFSGSVAMEVVADCSSIIPGAVANCDTRDKNFMGRLLTLDGNAESTTSSRTDDFDWARSVKANEPILTLQPNVGINFLKCVFNELTFGNYQIDCSI